MERLRMIITGAIAGTLAAVAFGRRLWQRIAGTRDEVTRARADLAEALTLLSRSRRQQAETVGALRRQMRHLEHMRRTGLWTPEQESALGDLRRTLSSLTESP